MKRLIIDNRKPLIKHPWIKLDNGSYRTMITLGSSDLLNEYMGGDGKKHYETIRKEDLFNEDSLKTAYGMPVTIGHPKNKLFNQNAEGLMVGTTLESFINADGDLLMPCTILDKNGIQLIDQIISDGGELLPEVSPVYWSNKRSASRDNVIVPTHITVDSNTAIYEQYDRKYDSIGFNFPGWGRGGQHITLRLDSNEYISTEYNHTIYTNENDEYIDRTEVETTTTRKSSYIMKIKIAGIEYPVEMTGESLDLDSFNSLIVDVDKKVSTDQKLLADQLADKKGEIAALKINLDSKNDLISRDEVSTMIAESIALWELVLPVLRADSKEFTPDYSLSPQQIKQLYIEKYHPDSGLNIDSNSEINGFWRAIAPTIAKKPDDIAVDRVRNQLNALQNVDINADSIGSDYDKAIEERRQRIENNYK
jgi:hypothetical protein